MRIQSGSILFTFVLMFCVSISIAETIEVPPIKVTSLVHSSYYDNIFDLQQWNDSVTFPSGPGGFSAPGFSASIGTGDTIVVRVEAPAGKKFVITKHPAATNNVFYLNAYWFTGTGDASSAASVGNVNFENLNGTAPTNTYQLHRVSDNGEAIKVTLIYDVNNDFSFTAMDIEFVVSHTLAEAFRTYGSVLSSSTRSFGATAEGAGGLADQAVMEIVDNVVTLTAPNGSEALLANSTTSVTWDIYGDTNMVLEYSTDSGVSWTAIATVPDTGSYAWALPDVNSNQCLVRISDSINTVSDQSDATFTIYQCTLDFDATGDCLENMEDFALFITQWLQCGNPFNPTCNGYAP